MKVTCNLNGLRNTHHCMINFFFKLQLCNLCHYVADIGIVDIKLKAIKSTINYSPQFQGGKKVNI